MEKHLTTNHPKHFSEYMTAKQAKKDAGKAEKAAKDQKRRAQDPAEGERPSKQPKIVDIFGGNQVLQLCVDLVVENGRPLKIFDDKPMQALIALAKKQKGEKTEIHSKAVKKTLFEFTKQKQQEIIKLLNKRVISLSADMASCRQRQFIGKLKLKNKT